MTDQLAIADVPAAPPPLASAPRDVTFTVHGIAAPAGSKRGFYNPKAKRVIITDDSAKSRPWKAQVSDAAAEAMGGRDLLQGPLELVIRFHVPRPKSHFGARGIRPSAPTHPAVKPDLTKLVRAVEDALTGLVWRDDAQVVIQHVFKEYGEPARCVVGVAAIQSAAEEAAA